MININETPIPPVEEVPLDTKLISTDPVVGQDFQMTVTVDDIDPAAASMQSSAQPSGNISNGQQHPQHQQQQNQSGDQSGAGAGIAGMFSPVMNFFRNSSAAATFSARLSDPPQGIRSMQPWNKFIGDKTKYSIPGLHYIWPRLQSNFTQFKYNYLAIAVLLLILIALFDFRFLLLVIVMGVLWGYIFWWRSEPIAPFGFEIPQKVLTIVFSIFTALIFYYIMGFKLFAVLIAVAVFSLIHSILYVSQEETIDFTRPV